MSTLEEVETKTVDLWQDIYCLTVLKLITENNPKLHRELIFKCVVCFGLQVALCIFVINDTEGIEGIYTGGAKINGVRLICTYLLHMMIMPELRNSL